MYFAKIKRYDVVYFDLSQILKKKIYIYEICTAINLFVYHSCTTYYNFSTFIVFYEKFTFRLCQIERIRFRTDCDEYSLVLHRRFSCTIFILAFIVKIITQKETKLQKLAITFHFLSTRDSHCRIQFEK